MTAQSNQDSNTKEYLQKEAEKKKRRIQHLLNSGRKFNSYQSWYRSISARLANEAKLHEAKRDKKTSK